MIGRRVDKEPHLLLPGEFTYWPNGGGWRARSPNGHLANLTAHDVTEHADGTITVSPSIGIRKEPAPADYAYHGYLERGVWREA